MPALTLVSDVSRLSICWGAGMPSFGVLATLSSEQSLVMRLWNDIALPPMCSIVYAKPHKNYRDQRNGVTHSSSTFITENIGFLNTVTCITVISPYVIRAVGGATGGGRCDQGR